MWKILKSRPIKYAFIVGIIFAILSYLIESEYNTSDFFVSGFFFGLILGVMVSLIIKLFASFKTKSRDHQPPITNITNKNITETNPINKKEVPEVSEVPKIDVDEHKTIEQHLPQINLRIDYIDNYGEDENNSNLVTKKLLHLKTIGDFRKLKDYIILDVETTGFDRKYDKIIEIAMLKVKDGSIIQEYQSLVNPAFIEWPTDEIAPVSNITNEELKNAPLFDDIVDDIINFMEDLPFVGHYANFDIAFIARELEARNITKDMFYYDTVSICKSVFPGLKSYKLSEVVAYLDIQENNTHRALDDVYATFKVLQICIEKYIENYEEEKKQKQIQKKIELAERKQKFSPSPLYDIGFAFTGEFSVDRNDMINALKNVGGLEKERITKQCKYLVKGNIDEILAAGMGKKLRETEKLIKDGADIKIISEKEFWDMISIAKETLEQ